MNAVSQTAFLALTDLRRQLGSPHSAITFVGSIVFVGFLFWLLAGFSIDHFLNAAFLMVPILILAPATAAITSDREVGYRSEEHTSELQSLTNLVCRLLLEKKNTQKIMISSSRTWKAS